MELRVLQYFLAVAREQSISGAADTLHLSQPTLSTQLKHLEEELGKQLMIRGTPGSRKIILTEEGMILRKRAEEILSLVKKTTDEISLSDTLITGDIYIGAGETDAIRLFAEAAKKLDEQHPGIRYHLFSGNATYVLEQLDKGLIDFGLVYGPVDNTQYASLQVPIKDTFGVLMRSDSPLSLKSAITPQDLWDQPLIVSLQEERDGWPIQTWMGCDISKIQIVATYNLLFNASLWVNEGLGYAVCLDKIINVSGDSSLCFRPLLPEWSTAASIIWKKTQKFSKPAEKFLQTLQSII